MRVLVVGSGGREHALVRAIAKSPLVTEIFCAPGNPGIATFAKLVPIAVTEIEALTRFAANNAIDLVVPGPEAPLVAGLYDRLHEQGIRCAGPSMAAAQLEGSKQFTKEVADAAGIPTARWEAFTDAEQALDFIRRRGAPIVVKADGLAAGKGVVVAQTVEEAEEAVIACLQEGSFGAAGARVVIEEFLEGPEVSVFALCDGTDAIFLGAARDHKRVGDGDTGPNTGGMGAIAPPPGFTHELRDSVMETIIRPTLHEMASRGIPFRGILFAGLMLTAEGPKLIEYNVRFGDPEAETLLPLLDSDIMPALLAVCDGGIKHVAPRWRAEASVSIVLAARGYPSAYERGTEIRGLDKAAADVEVTIFQAGTKADGSRILADGGRVLVVNATAPTLAGARSRAYATVDAIDWPEGFCRRDIGAHFT
ncbi:phosphoribosylamine--glycine ligase [Acidisoma silvae]|uniref:Phosphoribosylamine--glycine ligase n=1 Tax=Acidisoma silvae TaxID=2802396 RepID=A0A963YUJ8_9PROT|nr:phosphoribosylamine--glycine ligase [Acidisoma silvae]MCB8877303.1 phosphoribosylamine--glycine ligase [Acidisoma silvae]